MAPATSTRPTLAQVLLGLFILWQLFFLFASNYLMIALPDRSFFSAAERAASLPEGAAPAPEGAGLRAAGVVQDATTRWAQLTGQGQSWWLFAGYPRESVFPAIELRWADGRRPVRVHSSLEPMDPERYWHPPGSGDRLFHYELNVSAVYRPWDSQRLQEDPDRYQRINLARVRDDWRPVVAYLAWRLRKYMAEHPDAPPPDEVILLARVYETPPPGDGAWKWPIADSRPLFRWRPATPTAPGQVPIEVFDPLTRQFQGVKDEP
jgi:hypothetical protein